MEKYLVLGSNSFSASHCIDYLLNVGEDVIGVSRSPECNPIFLPYRRHRQENSKRFKFYMMDLNKDIEAIIGLINSFRPDYVINFAAQSMVAESWQNPEHWMITNIVSTIKFHDLLRKCDFLSKYVHVSTPEVYGTCSGFITENINYNPSTPYAVSRAACDMSLMTFFKTYKFPVVFTRAANVYGPGQQLYRIIPRTILFFLTGRKLKLHGGGRSVRSFIHIKDVVEGTISVARHAPAGEIYHFSADRNISINSLVRLIAKKLNISFDGHVEIVEDRPGKDNAYLLDSTKAKETLGWNPNISLEDGIEETIRWVKDNIKTLNTQALDYIHKP